MTSAFDFFINKDQYDETLYEVLVIPGAFMAFMLFAL